jgi:hypothetical protein
MEAGNESWQTYKVLVYIVRTYPPSIVTHYMRFKYFVAIKA